MKQIRTVLCILLICLMAFLLPACSRASKRSRESMDIATLLDGISRYSKFVEMVNEGIPEDLVLTICYMHHDTCTRVPQSADRLMTVTYDKKVVIGAKELAANRESLKKIGFDDLRLYDGGYPVNARLCYEFTTEEGKLLQVVYSSVGIHTVNGIPVEYNPGFYEAIIPFLKEEDRTEYDLDAWKEWDAKPGEGLG